MTRDRRLLVLLILLMAYGLFAVEGRHRPREDAENDARHRHRHRHESSNGRRNRHELADKRCDSSWSQELEFGDDSPADREDREDREDEEEDEDDYEDARFYYERSYPPRSSRNAVHGRAFEPRYPPRSHRGGGYRGTGWYEQADQRRRASPRYAARSYKLRSDRTHRRLAYSRNRDSDYVSEEDEFDYGKPRAYDTGDSLDRYASRWRSSRKHRNGAYGYDWRPDARKRPHRPDDSEPSRRVDDSSRRRPVYNDSWSLYSKGDRRRIDGSGDDEYRVEELDDEEEDAWKENEDEDPSEEEEDDDDEELDNDFYKTEKKAPLTTYDDIIRRLTSDDSTTPKATVKRDHRNSEADRHIKRDALGTFKYEPWNLSRPLARDRGKISAYVNAASDHRSPSKIGESLPGKLLGSLVERKSAKNASSLATKSGDRAEKKAGSKIDDTQPKTKSLEQDYEYLNTSDNEKEEDLAKAGVEEDIGMQADVTNTDYTGDEDEAETPATTSSTTTTTTTTTPRPVVKQNYDYRDPRGYEGSTGAQYNGYQSKNNYPPMSAYSDHKWRHLGTRDSVKETRSNMQQYNKSGKTSEIQEALQHANKVFRDGVCKWPQPRVIPVRDVYPSPSTTYTPHCAILHRCSDDTGCCRSEALTCVPKHSHRVELSFYTTNVGGGSLVEKLSFYNHTECECKERTEHDASNEKPSEQRDSRHHQSSPPHPNARWPQPRKPCRCPSEFTPRITSKGVCQCNCFETHQNCIKIRGGKGYFSLADRLCIQNEECAMPSCEFGEYMRRQGKCPKKKDKFDEITNYPRNLNYLRRRN